MGFAIKKDIVTKLTEMSLPVGARIVTMRLPLSKVNVSAIISVYVSTMTSLDEKTRPSTTSWQVCSLKVPAAFVHWVFNFLSNRPQCVRVGDIKSPVIDSNTGAPQGCVLSPVLYTLYTNDCRSVDPSTRYMRFSDDTAMLALFE